MHGIKLDQTIVKEGTYVMDDIVHYSGGIACFRTDDYSVTQHAQSSKCSKIVEYLYHL